MTDNAKRVLSFLKDNYGNDVTSNDIAEACGLSIPAVTGSVNGLVKKDYAVRTEHKTTGADGKEVTIKFISLTEAGLDYDPVAEEEAKAAEKERKAAERAAAKAAKAAAEEE